MSTTNEKILEHNVRELTEQLYDAYKRIKEQEEEIQGLNTVINALAEEAREHLRNKRL